MTTSQRNRPEVSEYPSFYAGYIGNVPAGDILTILRDSHASLASKLATIPESKGGFQYADGKWTIRTVLGHLIDAERIFSYRALRFARGDATPLPGFEENEYAKTAGSDARTVTDLVAEILAVRASTIKLFESLPDDAWGRNGVASVGRVSVRAISYIIAGHTLHHLDVLRERYGIPL